MLLSRESLRFRIMDMIMIAQHNGLAYGTLFEGCERWNMQDNRPGKTVASTNEKICAMIFHVLSPKHRILPI